MERGWDQLTKKIYSVVSELKKAGYDFDFEERIQEFVIHFKKDGKCTGTSSHVMKMDPFPLKRGDVMVNQPVHLEDVIRARIMNPEGSLYDTMHSDDFKKGKN